MAGLVIDASVAVKWFLREDRAEAAHQLIASGERLIAPDLVVFEVFSAIWGAVRSKRVPSEKLDELAPLIPLAFADLPPTFELYTRAAWLSSRYGHAVYDCIFLALAEREEAPLVTADDRLFAVARRARIGARLL